MNDAATASTLPAPCDSERAASIAAAMIEAGAIAHPAELEMRRLNAEYLLKAARAELQVARAEIAMLKGAMQTVEEVLLADPQGDDFTKSLAKALASARGVK